MTTKVLRRIGKFRNLTPSILSKRKRMILKATLLVNDRARRGFSASRSFFWTVTYRRGFWHFSWWCYSSGFATTLLVSKSNACKVEDSGNAWDRIGIIHWEVTVNDGTQRWNLCTF